MTRRTLDKYFTPAWQTRALLANQPISGTVLEPCAGDGAIARVIERQQWKEFQDSRNGVQSSSALVTNDIDPQSVGVYHIDASSEDLYKLEKYGGVGPVDWVVSNIPYKMPLCRDIVMNAVRFARIGVAMLLRLSFLEPTAKVHPRGPWLSSRAPDRILILPRYSYTQDGHSDSCTTAWMIWLRHPSALVPSEPAIQCLYDADVTYANTGVLL